MCSSLVVSEFIFRILPIRSMSYAKRRLHITISYNYIDGAGKVLHDLLHDVCDQVRFEVHEVVGKVLFVFHMHYTGMDITCLYTSSCEFICDGIRVAVQFTSDVIITYHCSA